MLFEGGSRLNSQLAEESFCGEQLSPSLLGAVTAPDVQRPVTDIVCDLEICMCSFITEHDLLLTAAQPHVDGGSGTAS